MADVPRKPGDLDPETAELSTTATDVTSANTARRIGPYRLLGKLGEGGMGEVWLAEQTEPVRREVALKIIKHGMDSKHVIARFEAERQALALMAHPAIARVYDAGVTPRGRPYFAMEHVQGVPITDHCDRHKLTNKQRLELFMQVCDGVQHAHHKSLIHRDLKPSNVLVAIRDGKPEPKIIDFGVAKATGHRLTAATLHTQLGAMIGTPAYMSPEQAEMTGQDVDTRTDVYALGVLLYELLVGALPFDPQELRQAGLEAMVRKIREEEPSKPSTRLSTLGEQSAESARRRRTNLTAMQRELSGDLDWITMRALEKDRTRRYDSPREFAADIERYLNDQPVLACPPSAVYRAGKFVKRHTGGVAVAAAALLFLIVFAATMTVQAGRIAAERDRANREAEAKGQVSEFLKDLFRVSDPSEARGKSITARELLDRGAETIEGRFEAQPETRAELMSTMGGVYSGLGLDSQAEPLLEQALAVRKRLLGEDHPDTLDSMSNLAELYWKQGRYDSAESFVVEILDKQKRVLGRDHPDTLDSMGNLAILYTSQGRYDEAEPLLLDTLDATRRMYGDKHSDTADSANNLAALYHDQGRYDEAAALYLEALETRKSLLGEDHPDTLASTINLGISYSDRGRFQEAESLYLKTLEIQRRVLGDDHPDTINSIALLAGAYEDRVLYDKAEPLYLQSLEARRRVHGNDHPRTLNSMNNLAGLYRKQGRFDEAELLLLEALETQQRTLGDDHPDALSSMNSLGALYERWGRLDESESLYLRALEAKERVLGHDHPSTAVTVHNLACLYRDRGHDNAGPFFERAQRIWEATLGPDHPYIAENLEDWAVLLRSAGEGDRADRMEARARTIRGE